MAKKKKKKLRQYDDYEEEEEDFYCEDDEEEEELIEEEDEVLESPSHSMARSVGGRNSVKKHRKSQSSLVRAKARPAQYRPSAHTSTRRYERERFGPHFAVPDRSTVARRNGTQVRSSIFVAWGKLFVLILTLGCGTWLAFSLSGKPQHKDAVHETPDSFKPRHADERVVPEIVQREHQTVSQRKVPSPIFHSTSALLDLSLSENQHLLKKEFSVISKMLKLSGGTFLMGDERGKRSDQRPAHSVTLSAFQMDEHPVTNREFQLFITATHYKTTAEKQGWSYVFDFDRKEWVKRNKACWNSPTGLDSWNDELWDHPVVHVSWDDANAFCQWSGKSLPTEAQWEYAARGGLVDQIYPWGKVRNPDEKFMANYWQGWFPDQNNIADGFLLTSPVKTFPANSFGLYDVSGNVWEWCNDRYSEKYYSLSSASNPQGPTQGEYRVVRGGSFLSAENHDAGYCIAVRSFQRQTTSYQDVGFRCVSGETKANFARLRR